KLHSESSPYHFLGHELKKPGIYTIAVVYENEGDSYWSQDEQKMIAVTNAWLGKVTSNTITIEVKEKVK
ncbi:MAG: hypothetical protein MUO85_07170, partial [candidate division Zixibacteria bacterium]|nr:hypothetical protein [candidate division Zixibacteria bacterium]